MKQFLVLKLIPMIFLSGALLAGCSDEPDCPAKTEVTKEISSDILAKIPYTGKETIKFKDAIGQTYSYVGTGKENFTETRRSSGNADPACGAIYTTNYLLHKISFLSGDNSIVLTHFAKGYIQITMNNRVFDVIPIAISNDLLNTYSFYDSLLINDNYYFKVSAVPNFQNDTLFINENEGILGMRSANSNFSILK